MPKIAKRFLLGGAIIVALLALFLLCINLYLQSGGVQQRIRNAAADALGAEIKVRSTTYTPWSGLVLRDISIPDPIVPNSNTVEAAALRIRFALSPLLGQRFVVTECTLFEPKLIVRQLEDGNWLIPLPPRAKAAAAGKTESSGPKIKGPAFKVELQRFRLGSGQISFVNAKKSTILLLERADIEANITPDLKASGLVEIKKMNIGNSLKPSKLEAPFTWDGQVLDFPNIKGSLASGSLTGKYRLTAGDAPTYALAAQLNGVLLKRLADDAGIEPGKTAGELQGWMEMNGDPRHSDSASGKGHFELVKAQLTPMELINKLGQLFQIEELQLLKLSEAKLDFTIGNERVQLDDVYLKSENLVLRGQGPIRFNGKLKIDAKLLINQKLQRQLKGLLNDNFVQSDDPEYKQLSFTVDGKVDKPRSDIIEKVTGVPKDIGGVLQNIFRAIPTQKKSGDGNKEGN